MKCVFCKSEHFTFLFSKHTWDIKKCGSCGLVQAVPMPTPKQIASLYHDDLEHFEPYIEQIAVHRQYFISKIKELPKGGTLLDIGCAMGVLLEAAQNAGFDAYGVDISKDAVKYCKKRGLKVSTTYPNRTFDIITAFEVIEHERDPYAFMSRIHKMLKKGGTALLTTPNHSGFWSKIMGKYWVSYRHPEHVTFWDPTSLHALFLRAGFRDIKVKRDTPRPFPLSFLFSRGADYFPWAGWILRPIGKLIDKLKLINPINPWDDLIVYAKK